MSPAIEDKSAQGIDFNGSTKDVRKQALGSDYLRLFVAGSGAPC